MKRPQSAKQVRNYWAQVSSDEGVVKDSSKPFIRMNNKPLMNAVSSNNDFSRLLPKRIQQDKQRLYCETLQLKTTLNEVIEENHRLKTKIAIIQREKDKKYKKQDQCQRSITTSKAKITDKEPGIVINLKKLVRESKEESENYRKEVLKLKRALRYIKMNEIEVQKETIYEQNRNLAKIIQRLQSQLNAQLNKSQQNQNLAVQFENTLQKLKQFQEVNQRYEELLQEQQMKNRGLSQKIVVLQQKLQRDLAVQRRKTDLLTKQNEALRRQNKQVNQKLQEERKKANAKKSVRPASSHPQSYTTNTKTHQNEYMKPISNKQKQIALQKNAKLQNELQQAKKKLAVSQNQLKEQLKYNSNTLNLSNQPFELQLTKNDIGQLSGDTQKFTSNEKNVKIETNKSKNAKNQVQTKKEPKKAEVMNQIKQLLTYRMKYNRYTFAQLKSDIQATPLARFTYKDLLTMFVDEPFSLNDYYATQFLKSCYGKSKISNNQQIQSTYLIDCLRNTIQDFQLIDQHQQQQMLYKIAECLTKKRQELLRQFSKLKVKSKLVNKKQLCDILQQSTVLSSKELDLVISYVSMSCQSLQKIDYEEVLDKFYLKNNSSKSMQNSENRSKQKSEQELSLGEAEPLEQDQQLYGQDQII